MTHAIFRILTVLDKAHVSYTLARDRDDSIMITTTTPGARIEVDVFEDGHIEYSKFLGDEGVESDVGQLFKLLEIEAPPD